MISSDEMLWAFLAFIIAAWLALRYFVVFKADTMKIVLLAVIGLFALPYLPLVIGQDIVTGGLIAFAAVFAVKNLFKSGDWVKSAALVLVLYVVAGALLGFNIA